MEIVNGHLQCLEWIANHVIHVMLLNFTVILNIIMNCVGLFIYKLENLLITVAKFSILVVGNLIIKILVIRNNIAIVLLTTQY